jgi:hypothetical protein
MEDIYILSPGSHSHTKTPNRVVLNIDMQQLWTTILISPALIIIKFRIWPSDMVIMGDIP